MGKLHLGQRSTIDFVYCGEHAPYCII